MFPIKNQALSKEGGAVGSPLGGEEVGGWEKAPGGDGLLKEWGRIMQYALSQEGQRGKGENPLGAVAQDGMKNCVCVCVYVWFPPPFPATPHPPGLENK